MFWNSVARWISHAPRLANSPNSSEGSVDAPCCTAPAKPYFSRASLESACSVSKSSFTVATPPPGSGTPPWLVPVWIEILLIPGLPGASFASCALNPSTNATSSSAVEFLPPTSPISPPTDTVVPAGSCLRMNVAISAHTRAFAACCSACVGCDRSTSVEVSTSMLWNPARQCLGGQVEHALQLGVGARGVLLGINLKVIALQEDRARPALPQRRGQHHERVLGGPLVGVRDLRARDLADHRAGIELLPRPEQRASGVVGQPANVDRGHGECRGTSPRPRAR